MVDHRNVSYCPGTIRRCIETFQLGIHLLQTRSPKIARWFFIRAFRAMARIRTKKITLPTESMSTFNYHMSITFAINIYFNIIYLFKKRIVKIIKRDIWDSVTTLGLRLLCVHVGPLIQKWKWKYSHLFDISNRYPEVYTQFLNPFIVQNTFYND